MIVRRYRGIGVVARGALVCWSLAIIAVSLYIFNSNVVLTILYNSIFELLHAQTISSIILGSISESPSLGSLAHGLEFEGLKPLINGAIVLAFLLNIGRHHKFLTQLDHMDRLFFQVPPSPFFSPSLRLEGNEVGSGIRCGPPGAPSQPLHHPQHPLRSPPLHRRPVCPPASRL